MKKVSGGCIFSIYCFRCGKKVSEGHKNWYKDYCCEECFDKLDKAQIGNAQFDLKGGKDITQQLEKLNEKIDSLKGEIASLKKRK